MSDQPKAQSAWMRPDRPFWFPDAQGFVIGAVVLYVGASMFYRMSHPAEINDKLLDMMLTILYGTAFVAIVNYLVGSSRGSDSKSDTQNKIVEKLTSTSPAGTPGPVSPVTATVTSWWTLLTEDERAKITDAASRDARAQTFTITAAAGRADVDDLIYLTRAGLLTQERATAIAAA